MGRQPPVGQPPLQLLQVGLTLPTDSGGQPGQFRAGDPVSGQVDHRGRLEQMGDHVLHEPHIGLVAACTLAGGGGGTAARQQRDHQPPSSRRRIDPLALAVCLQIKSTPLRPQ